MAVENRFDTLAKAIADGSTRRGLIRQLGRGLAAAMLAPFGAALKASQPRPRLDCRAFCRTLPVHQQQQCYEACRVCPADLCGSPGAFFCCPSGLTCCPGGCGTTCTDTQTDPLNCGECGRICPPDSTCVAGRCTPACAAGQTLCVDPATGAGGCCYERSSCC